MRKVRIREDELKSTGRNWRLSEALTPFVAPIRPQCSILLIGNENVKNEKFMAFPQPGALRKLVNEILRHFETV